MQTGKHDKKLAIIQSGYIPWKGYFDIMNMADEFIFLDDVQYTRRDWRNRNLIKTPIGVSWLTIPVDSKGKFNARIMEMHTTGNQWRKLHWDSIRQNYSNAAFFESYYERFKLLYLDRDETRLSEINLSFIREINIILGITTKLSQSVEHPVPGKKNEKLVGLCKSAGAKKYISGPSAKVYLDENLFNKEGISVEWMDYSAYPEYRQLFGPFEHHVSILDLIFNEGPNAASYMKSGNNKYSSEQ